MPFLDTIVEQLNQKIIDSSLNFLPKGRVKSFGISESMIYSEEVQSGGATVVKTTKYPAIINDDGEATMIEVDDTYSVIMYHRLESITNGPAPKQVSWGRQTALLEVANLSLVVFAFRDMIKKTPWWMEGAIKDQFPDSLDVKDSTNTKVLQNSVIRASNSSFDKLSLLAREYSYIELNFSQLMLFDMKYRIESAYTKGCFNNCEC